MGHEATDPQGKGLPLMEAKEQAIEELMATSEIGRPQATRLVDIADKLVREIHGQG